MKVRLDIEVDEEVARDLDRAAERLGCSKATFVEEAIRDKAMNAEPRPVRDPAEVERILKASFGVMKREETPEETVRQIKEATRRMYEDKWARWDAER